MTGVVLANYFAVPSGLPIALALLAINLWVIYENRQKYLSMIQ